MMNNYAISGMRESAKVIALLLTAVLVGSLYLINLGNTLASPDDINVVHAKESGISDYYTVEIGETKSFNVLNLNEAKSSNPGIAAVTFDSGTIGEVRTKGVKAGVAGVSYGNRVGVVTAIQYHVTDSDNVNAYTIKDGGEMYFSDPDVTKASPVIVTAGDSGRIEWSSLNTSVATVDSATGAVTSTGIGATVIIGKYIDKWGVPRDLHLLAVVGVISGGGGSEEPIVDVATPVDGNVLSPEQTGDTAAWIEIARNGGYSLIVRGSYLNTYPNGHNDEPMWNADRFGTNNSYGTSRTRSYINAWFNGTAAGTADVLPENARLRDFAVQNDAMTQLGSGPVIGGIDDGFSKPIPYKIGWGSDIAFALSYGEAANYLSNRYDWDGGVNAPSNDIAKANFAKIYIPDISTAYNMMWLRSPGTESDRASVLDSTGRVFQSFVDSSSISGFSYPALWVDSKIFD